MPGNSLCAAMKIFLANRRFVFFARERIHSECRFLCHFFLSLRYFKKTYMYIDNRSILKDKIDIVGRLREIYYTKCNTIFSKIIYIYIYVIRIYDFVIFVFKFSNFAITKYILIRKEDWRKMDFWFLLIVFIHLLLQNCCTKYFLFSNI